MENKKKIDGILQDVYYSDRNMEEAANAILALFDVSHRIYLLTCARNLSQNSWVVGAFKSKDKAEKRMKELDNDKDYTHFITDTKLYGG